MSSRTTKKEYKRINEHALKFTLPTSHTLTADDDGYWFVGPFWKGTWGKITRKVNMAASGVWRACVLTRYVHDVDVDVVSPQDNERYEDNGKPRHDPEEAVTQRSAAGQQFEVKKHSQRVPH